MAHMECPGFHEASDFYLLRGPQEVWLPLGSRQIEKMAHMGLYKDYSVPRKDYLVSFDKYSNGNIFFPNFGVVSPRRNRGLLGCLLM